MTAAPWMDEAWSLVGQAEYAGEATNPRIKDMFDDLGVAPKHGDETPWCGALTGAVLFRHDCPVPAGWDALRARAYLEVGTPIDKPRVGAVAIFSRGTNPAEGHVGFVTGETATHLMILGGNQANSVSVAPYPKARLIGLRWPAAPAAPEEIAGSRTVEAAGDIRRDAAKGAAAQAVGQGAQGAGQGAELDPAAIANQATEFQGTTQALIDFGAFAANNALIIATLVGLYYLARMVWRAGWIKQWRAEDHNTGAHQGRGVA